MEVTVDQIEACLSLFKVVKRAMNNAVTVQDEVCIWIDIWNDVLDAYAAVNQKWDW